MEYFKVHSQKILVNLMMYWMDPYNHGSSTVNKLNIIQKKSFGVYILFPCKNGFVLCLKNKQLQNGKNLLYKSWGQTQAHIFLVLIQIIIIWNIVLQAILHFWDPNYIYQSSKIILLSQEGFFCCSLRWTCSFPNKDLQVGNFSSGMSVKLPLAIRKCFAWSRQWVYQVMNDEDRNLKNSLRTCQTFKTLFIQSILMGKKR